MTSKNKIKEIINHFQNIINPSSDDIRKITQQLQDIQNLELQKISQDNVYNENNYNVKEIFNKDDKTIIYQQKKKIYTYNIYDFNLRIAISKENIIKQYKSNNDYVLREKERYSFDLKYCNIDLTKVKQDNKIMFEIELELKEKINIDMLNKILSLILFTKDLSQNIITVSEKNKIINVFLLDLISVIHITKKRGLK